MSSQRRRDIRRLMRDWLLNAPDEGVPADTLLRQAYALGYTRDDCRNACRDLSVEKIRERDPATGRTVCWRWRMPLAPIDPTLHPPAVIPADEPEPITQRATWGKDTLPPGANPDDYLYIEDGTGHRHLTHALGDEELARLRAGGTPKRRGSHFK